MSQLPETSPAPIPPTNGNGNGPPLDLPPVEPPTAGFIVQLFVIPAVIVAVVIVVWLLFGKLAGGERDANDYVEMIRSGNETRRWRAAHELASLIGNDPRLAKDERLLGSLTDLLNTELANPQSDARLRVYLAVALGTFRTLDAIGPGGRKVEPLETLARALDAKQPNEVRRAAAESLAKQAARREGRLDDPAAESALARASDDSEAELRKRATFALGFFGGEGAVEPLRKRLNDEDREVRYNAALALGRHGDVAALPMFREMLSTQDLSKTVQLATEEETRHQIELIELTALRALQTSLSNGHPSLPQLLRKEIAELTRSQLDSVRLEAEAVLKILPPLKETSLSPRNTGVSVFHCRNTAARPYLRQTA